MAGNESGPVRVLIVEDDPGLANLYCIWVSEDFEVTVSYDGEQALESLDSSVDVVLLDRRMPGLSGNQVLNEIRERDYDCRVAMVSAVEPDFDVLDMGFDDYVKKPITRADLLNTVERLVALASYDRDVREYFAMLSKQANLRAEKNASELQSSEDYVSLEADIDDMRLRVDTELSTLLDQNIEQVFRG